MCCSFLQQALIVLSGAFPCACIGDEPAPEPTHADVAYGKHPRQKLDFWRAESADPTPVFFYLHGGGWTHGDKADVWKRGLTGLLDAGVSVVSINYRYVPEAREAGVKPPVSWPMHDAARALQFVRSKAGEWQLDKDRVAVSGTSAGACTVLWLAFHDELADPDSPDPVARESTRVTCAAVFHAQTSLDPKQMKEWTPNSRYGGHAFAFDDPADPRAGDEGFDAFLEKRESILPWIGEYSPYALASSDDPPVFLAYRTPPDPRQPQKDPTHSANFGVMLQERLEALGVDCELDYPGARGRADLEAWVIDRLKPSSPGGQRLPLRLFEKLQAGGRQTVVVYGTSLSHMAEWPKALARYFDREFPGQVECVNAASSGKPSSWGVENLGELVLPHDPDLVFIEFSMNDSATKHGISVEKGIENLDRMVGDLRAANPEVEIVLQTMNRTWDTATDPGTTAASDRPELARYYESYRRYAREHQLVLIDHEANWNRLQESDPVTFKQYLPDGTHPVPEGSLAVTWPAIEAVFEEARAVRE